MGVRVCRAWQARGNRAMGALMVLALNCSAASAQGTCPLAGALYEQDSSGYTLRFGPKPSYDGASESFAVAAPDFKRPLTGSVGWSDRLDRTLGRLTLDCPLSPTKAELDACTLWTGVLYAVYADGEVRLLPEPGDPAPQSLLLPDFARSLLANSSSTGFSTEEIAWDAFTLVECAS